MQGGRKNVSYFLLGYQVEKEVYNLNHEIIKFLYKENPMHSWDLKANQINEEAMAQDKPGYVISLEGYKPNGEAYYMNYSYTEPICSYQINLKHAIKKDYKFDGDFVNFRFNEIVKEVE